MKSIVKSALVLTAIALVAGILLAVVHKFTFQPYVFSLTAEDKAAISSITDTKKFDYIEHTAIKADSTVRVVLRGADGSDKNNVLIRAYGIGYAGGSLDTYTLVDATTGKIKKVAYVTHDKANSYFYSHIKLEMFCKSMEGRDNLGKFDKNIDGGAGAGATGTLTGLYDSVKNAINYYTDNASAIKSAQSGGTVDVGAVDKLLTAIKKLYPDAKSHTELSSYEAAAYTIKIIMTDTGDFVFSYTGTVTYLYDGDPHTYQSEILMKIGANGKIDGSPVYFTGDLEYFDKAIDGTAGATGSGNFIRDAIAAVEAYYSENDSALTGQTDVLRIFSKGAGKYLAIVKGTTPDGDQFETYNFVIAVGFDNGALDGIKTVSSENYKNYMDGAIDGSMSATYSQTAINAAVEKAKAIVEGL